jgi:hypothetical protein
MKIHHAFFKIPVHPAPEQTEALRQFIDQHSIINTHREFVSDGANSFWAYDIEVGVEASRSTITNERKVTDMVQEDTWSSKQMDDKGKNISVQGWWRELKMGFSNIKDSRKLLMN